MKTLLGEFKNANGHNRGLLTPILSAITQTNAGFITAGTAFTMSDGKSVASDIGKPRVPTVTEFNPLGEKDVERYLDMYLDIDMEDLHSSKDWSLIVDSRPRLAAVLLSKIIDEEGKHINKDDRPPKRKIVEDAVVETVKTIREQLTAKLREHYSASNQSAHAMFKKLYVACRYVRRNKEYDV